jgi:hypothetical protein
MPALVAMSALTTVSALVAVSADAVPTPRCARCQRRVGAMSVAPGTVVA